MRINAWIRQLHRWFSVLLTLSMVAYMVVASGLEKDQLPPPAITYTPLALVFLLLFSGWYLFALPYVAKWRGKQE